MNDRHVYGLTRAQGEAFLERQRRIIEVFQEVRVVNPPPAGVAIKPSGSIEWGSVGERESGRWLPVEGYFLLGHLPYYNYGRSKGCETGEGAVWVVSINSIEINALFRTGSRWAEDEDGRIYLAPREAGQVAGFPMYQGHSGNCIVLTKRKKPLWVPVSQERFLRAKIREGEARLAEIQKSMDADPSGKARHQAAMEYEYQRWLELKARQRREFEASYAKLKDPSPPAAEKLRADHEEWEKRNEEAHRRAVAEADASWQAPANNVRAQIEVLQAELDALSPAARAAQAFLYVGGLADWAAPRASGLTDPHPQRARPLVSPNPDFFDPSLPRTAFQVLIASPRGSERDPQVIDLLSRDRPLPAYLATLRELRQTVDWQRIADFLD